MWSRVLDRFGALPHSPALQFPQRAQPLFPFPKCSQGHYCSMLTATEGEAQKLPSPWEEEAWRWLFLQTQLNQGDLQRRVINQPHSQA